MSYSTNYKNATFIYIAYSKQSNLFKVGITKNTSRRIDAINQAKLGMVSDWVYIGFVRLGAGVLVVTPIDLLMVKFTFYKRSNNLIVHLFAFRKTNGFSY
ncbi:hypothetical protein PDPUS_1_01724 [Photobacterium damselae subsp. piscicida]|uniref:Uncharacterized protein n=1 Tax=Photobacterium damsela subsp. piscicida TaxID=38294 RepID=A0AAD1CF19_PHODP|nr:hypothetical protein [Photobacterium damselae]BAX53098.1 hypothetical protein PDPUS_1_01724 [Photobacterium damselae subsp. piscicida]GAW45572.1 hypothetical protein PDPJ_1_02987 [Photobacterium damselae subsp. piscicida]